MKLIKRNEEDYIIVDGFEVKDEKDLGVWVYDDDYDEPLIYKTDEDFFKAGKSAWRITHSFGKQIDGVINKPLSEVKELLLGYSVEKMAESKWNELTPELDKLDLDTLYKAMWCGGFQHGFNAHKELTKDRILEKEFIDWIDKEEVLRSGGGWIKYFNGRGNYFNSTELYDFWKSLQPTEWEVEFINGKLTFNQ